MNCQVCQKVSDAYREGKLPGDMKTQVEDHLATCKECEDIYNMQVLAERVISQEKELLSNPFLITRIMEQIEDSETPHYKTVPAFTRVLRTAIITSSLAAAIFLGVMMGNIYKPTVDLHRIPLELAMMDDATIESVNIFAND